MPSPFLLGGIMREFNFEKNYEEFKIGGKVYKMYFDDESIKTYQKLMREYADKATAIQKSYESMNEDEKIEAFNQTLELATAFLDSVLGKGSFDELYEASGKSSASMATLIEWLGKEIAEKTKSFKAQKLQKYKK